jgi:enoyl-CoA hydratase/carnithine racemase
VLDVCEALEEALAFPVDQMTLRWRVPAANDLVLERRDEVATIRIDRPERRNALTRAALERLPGLLADAVATGARAVVVTGGPRCFSSGVDLDELRGTGVDAAVDTVIAEAVGAIRSLRVPVIAAIEGPCAGAAVELAVACDVRVAGSGAFFLLPAAKLGLLYRPEATARLTAELGRQTVSRLLLLGERIPADDAVSAGIVARVVPAGEALGAALALAERAAAGERKAVQLTKHLIAESSAAAPPGEAWELRRRELLESDARRDAVTRAKEELAR